MILGDSAPLPVRVKLACDFVTCRISRSVVAVIQKEKEVRFRALLTGESAELELTRV